MINNFSKIYKEILEPDVLSIYFNLCKEIPDNQGDYIQDCCLKKCHYFPRPDDIFKCFEEIDPLKKYYEKENV